jgi:RHH-type rel operon transcriptional repressor/antitoxin RelB
MAVSVRLEPLLEKELELAAKRLGVTKSQFIVSALERALGRHNPYELLLKVQAQAREPLPEGGEYISPTKAAIGTKLRAKQEASRTDWLAFQEAKQAGRAWQPDADQDAP